MDDTKRQPKQDQDQGQAEQGSDQPVYHKIDEGEDEEKPTSQEQDQEQE